MHRTALRAVNALGICRGAAEKLADKDELFSNVGKRPARSNACDRVTGSQHVVASRCGVAEELVNKDESLQRGKEDA